MSAPARDTVVVGVDGTDDGRRALLYGVALAKREDLDLRLVHVAHQTEMYAPMLPYLPEPQVLLIGESVLRDARQLAEEAGFDESRTGTVLAHGPRTSALLSNADDARCLVVGTRASTLRHLFTGSTSLSLAARAPAPVHCVPRSWEAAGAPYGRIVVGLDGSPADLDVLEAAFREAEPQPGTSLRLVHAWRPVSPYDAAITGRVLQDEWAASVRDVLAKQVEQVAGRHPGATWDLELDFERVPVALHEAAAHADLLVLGRHGHLAPGDLTVGSNARTLLRTATCPVVVVPIHTGHEK